MTSASEIAVLEALEASGALRRGHFRLSSGRHSADYVQCALLLQSPERARWLGTLLARKLAPADLDSVASPALGGLLIGHEVAAALNVPFRFTERKQGRMTLRRGFTFGPGERVAIVEDVVTTGQSTRETIDVVEEAGARVVEVAAIIDRTRETEPFDVPFRRLLEIELETFDSQGCPLCEAGLGLSSPGSRLNL